MDELTVQKTRCTCHPQTCGHWPYSLMLGSERITTGEKADCERMLALLTAWNTRAASGGDVAIKGDRSFTPNLEEPASLEQRARELLAQEYERHGLHGSYYIANPNTDRPDMPDEPEYMVVEAAIRAITAALANQQGVGDQ